MQIDIPQEAEAFVRTQAAKAGFDNVTDYVLSLIASHDPDSSASVEPQRPVPEEIAATTREALIEKLREAHAASDAGQSVPFDVEDTLRRGSQRLSGNENFNPECP